MVLTGYRNGTGGEFARGSENAGACRSEDRRIRTLAVKPASQCAPYTALRELVCTLPVDGASKYLFCCCPNLVTAEFLGVRDDVRLPLPPFPHTLRHIILHGEPDGDGEQDGVDFAPLLAWHEQNIAHLTLVGAQSTHYPFSQFLAHCRDTISLRVSARAPDVILAAKDGSRRWEVSTCPAFWEFGRLAYFLELINDRIAHLSMCIEHIEEFFNAQARAPHLASLELCLTGAIDDSLPLYESEYYFLRAPRLRHFALDITGSDNDVEAHEYYIKDVLDALRSNFRSLIIYDADLLETVTVRSTARVVKHMNCADFAQFAQRFIETN